MKRKYVKPEIEKITFDYEEQVVACSTNPQALNYIRDHGDDTCHNTSCSTTTSS